jgi:hypothetical protein
VRVRVWTPSCRLEISTRVLPFDNEAGLGSKSVLSRDNVKEQEVVFPSSRIPLPNSGEPKRDIEGGRYSPFHLTERDAPSIDVM